MKAIAFDLYFFFDQNVYGFDWYIHVNPCPFKIDLSIHFYVDTFT